MRLVKSLALAWLCASPLAADGQKAGEFDYYVLSLSWSPTWCAL
ncbi:MAG: ribonuclease T, partial [Rhodobacteraceae bacterium]|nr:ribonuclease T [Paracoccaceae bacterium]